MKIRAPFCSKTSSTFESKKILHEILHSLLLFIFIRNKFEKVKKYRAWFLKGKDKRKAIKYVNTLIIIKQSRQLSQVFFSACIYAKQKINST